MEFSVGQLLSLGPQGNRIYHFQNFSINDDVLYGGITYGFLPFGFSGSVISLKGDNVDASLVFPATTLSQSWAEDALLNQWVAEVDVVLFTAGTTTVQQVLYSYFGVFSAGGWNDTSLEMRLNTVLDAVGSEIPARRLHRALVGKIPFTAQISV